MAVELSHLWRHDRTMSLRPTLGRVERPRRRTVHPDDAVNNGLVTYDGSMDRDGRMPELAAKAITTSELLARGLPRSWVVKPPPIGPPKSPNRVGIDR